MKLGDTLLSVFKRPRPFPVRAIVPFSGEERKRFREIIADPVFKHAIENAYAKKPSVYTDGTGTSKPDMLAGNNRLHQIQGWDMFEAALFAQAEEPFNKNKKPLEDYPNAGNSY